jgi:UPF0716 protein FxsA
MPLLLVLLFVGVPLLEILVILQVGAAIGGWPTAIILVLDSLLGAWLLKVEGRRAWSEFRRALEEGRWPGDEVAQGALIIVGGTLLVTPGFVTDVVGFAFLLRPTRRLVANRVRVRVGRAATGGAGTAGGGAAGGRGGAGDLGGRSRDADGRARDPRAGGHRGRPDRGGAQRPRRAGEDIDLEVEVVEIQREQPPLRDPDPPGSDPEEPEDGPRRS